MTITFMKSTKGKVSGGYLHIPWKNDSSYYCKDEKAFIFSLNEKLVLKPTNPDKAIYFYKSSGPNFGYCSLNVWTATKMNQDRNCYSYTLGHKGEEWYNVPVDPEGNSVLSGEKREFTLEAMETWAVEYE